jgi:hypothetical protein
VPRVDGVDRTDLEVVEVEAERTGEGGTDRRRLSA